MRNRVSRRNSVVRRGYLYRTMTNRWSARSAIAAVALVACVAVGSPAPTAPTAKAQVSALGAGVEFHQLTPARNFDSRSGSAKTTINDGNSFDVCILGQGGVPTEASSVLAVVANVTVVGSGAAGYLSIRPAGSSSTPSSLVNFNPVEAVPNLAVIGVGGGGRATVTLTTPGASSSAHVLVDVFGWISTSTYSDVADSGARFVPLGPSRFLDTRSVPVPATWSSGRSIGSFEQLTLPIRGVNGVPDSSNITGVMVNLTAANNQPGSVPTFLAATPTTTPAGSEPATSVTNVSPGQVKANTAIVPIGPDGAIRIFNRSGATHVIVDVLGYLQGGAAETSREGRVIPLDAPFRVFDTRQPEFASTPLGFSTKEEWSFKAFAESVTLNGAPIGRQSALIGNLTGTGLTPLVSGQAVTTYMTLYPGNGAPPNSSNINVTPGRSVPNMSLLRYGTVGDDPYMISAFNFDGSIHYLLDVYAVVLAD